MCCSWTNCDWIGDNDDLIDHIMEIHVELQPYHNLKDIISSSLSSSGCSSSSPDALTNHELMPTATNGNDDDTSNSMSASNNHMNCQINDNCRKSKTNETIDITSTVDQQTQLYVCLWEGCKVYGKGSLSKSWIERHVLQHSGPRPFKCIVEGCNQRFKKREALERHVNSHFLLPINDLSSSLPNLSSNLSPTLNGDHTQGPAKMSPRNGPSGFHMMTSSSLNRNKLRKKRVKARKKYISSRASEDYFDESIMELINFRLTEISMLTGLDVLGNHSDLVFHSKVIGKCCPEKDGATKVLLRWEPEGIMPDEWISESDLNEMSSRRIPLKSLPIDSLNKILEETSERRTRGRKFRKD